MIRDLIFDAMDYIDDDMLNEVGSLRMRGAPRRNRTWMRWASMAACLCLVMGGIWLSVRTGVLDFTESEDSVKADDSAAQGTVVRAGVRIKDERGVEWTVNDAQRADAICSAIDSYYTLYYKYNSHLLSESQQPEGMMAAGEDADEKLRLDGSDAQYVITVTADDGDVQIYWVEENRLRNRTTGECIVLSAAQLTELNALLRVKP
ncbi:MAG: hypothetical protein IKL84_00625 [Clostridia bacterium]|nr:hypothetical protein [Clostridia bacterium]